MAKKLSKKQQIIETLIQFAYDKANTPSIEKRREINLKAHVVMDILAEVFEMDHCEALSIFEENYTMYRQMNRY